MVNPYSIGLDRSPANYTPLTPLSLLARTAYVYPNRPAVIYGATRYSWADVYSRCRKLA
jgi:fatty-acyl-CoA synthase